MKTQRFIIIVSSIIIGFILIGLLAGFLIKSNHKDDNNHNGDDNDDIFKEIPFKYKLPIAKMGDCPLINSKPSDKAPQCPIALNYSETANQFGMWPVDPLTDKSQSMCISTNNGCLTNYSYVKPKWNWIIGTCKGKSCSGVDSGITDYKYYTNAKNHGTDLIVNYVGSYQYDQKNNTWVCQQDSSFNMDGKHPPQDIMKNDQNWLPGPLPGGSANWGAGYYPAGRSGVGAPAFAFIISVEKIFNAAWYMLNQSTLDRGPINSITKDALIKSGLSSQDADGVIEAGNTWGSKARSGEWDILESTMIGQEKSDNLDYLKLYANTDTNPGSNGICLHHGTGTNDKQSGGWNSTKYFVSDNYNINKSTPRVFFTIMDANGTTVFQIPTYDGAPEYWKGIGRKSADMTIPGKFTGAAPATGACSDPKQFCATFMPSCAAKTREDASNIQKYGCSTKGLDPWCGNFIAEKLVSTHNVWGKTKAFGTMEWTTEMET
jgi:hypothetical protein